MKRVLLALALAGAGIGGALVLQAASAKQQQPTAAPDKSADVSGKWHFINQTDGGPREMDAVFKLDGEQVAGKYGKADVKGTFKDGDLDLAFPYDSEEAGMTATLKIKGKLKDGKLSGNWQYGDYEGTFTATRSD